MTKEQAIAFMISEVEKVERARLAAHFSIDANREKKEAVKGILNSLEGVQIEDEDN